MIFRGNEFAEKLVADLQLRIGQLSRRPKLVVIVDPANSSGMKYTLLKQKMAHILGVEFKIYETQSIEEATQIIKKSNADIQIDGVMIQMPFPSSETLIDLIDPKKDVDGLREDSPYQPAAVRAVMEILYNALSDPPLNLRGGRKRELLVVGSRGFVGSRLVKELHCEGLDIGDDLNKLKAADVIISATGQPGLIKPEMVKEGVVAIDVGYPQPEFTAAALSKASFFTPVPGGVGPVTVVLLFANLLEATA